MFELRTKMLEIRHISIFTHDDNKSSKMQQKSRYFDYHHVSTTHEYDRFKGTNRIKDDKKRL